MASFLLLLFLISNAAATATLTTTRIPLSKSPSHPSSPSNNAWESITLAARSSLTRARDLKRRPSITGTIKLPAYPRSYGGYSIRLSLGTPPQQVFLVLDTGSSLVWTPCTPAYSCHNCSFSGMDPTKIPIYSPNISSTVRWVTCRSPQCRWVLGSDLKCPHCHPKRRRFNCTSATRQPCPGYQLKYGLGSTEGLLLSDNLVLSKRRAGTVGDFLFGCSLISESQPEGIAGFGRGLASLPAQLGLAKFSYCMVSHEFDDSTRSGDLILYGGGGRASVPPHGVSYAPFRKSPADFPYSEYYYIALSNITVGGKIVQFPSGYLVASAKGNGGVIVDSGSTLTFMERAIYDPLAQELEKQMWKYKRAKDVEEKSGLGPCYDLTGQNDVEFPILALLFTGGARMELPSANYFSYVGGPRVACMTVFTDPEGTVDSGVPIGPAVILGNYLQQNLYVEYDLMNQRFGFKPQQCDHARN